MIIKNTTNNNNNNILRNSTLPLNLAPNLHCDLNSAIPFFWMFRHFMQGHMNHETDTNAVFTGLLFEHGP